MEKIIKLVLNKIEKNGFEAYIVGGYVRDHLLGIESTDIDICTNALPQNLIEIFKNNEIKTNKYGGIKVKIKKFTFDITTYRQEKNYINGKPSEVEYVDNLLTDIARRDLTINAMCMNKDSNIIDLVNAKEDFQNKKLRLLNDPDLKLQEDPTRILRILRFATITDFEIEEKSNTAIKKYYKNILNLSSTTIRRELDKIFLSKNIDKGINLLTEYKILELLDLQIENITPVNDICAIYSQIELSDLLEFTKNEKSIIKQIKEIINNQEITNQTLYNYGLHINLLAGEILKIPTSVINDKYDKIPIYKAKELKISVKEICQILNIENHSIKIVLNDIIDKVLNNELKNNKKSIKEYLQNRR